MRLPHVSSEGGPIILGDFEALRGWRGISDSSGHYEAACQLVERANPSPIAVGGADCLVWEFGGPGTGEIVLVSDTQLSVVRIWPDGSWTEAETEAAVISAATARYGTARMAQFTIKSGYLLALWATEDASAFLAPHAAQGVPQPGLSIGDGGTYLRTPCGRYEVTACEWQAGNYDITKLDLRRTTDVG
jgi:hypothetical protein